ncbi:MAG TPA: murein biosynthesis integral membrane protein MurJ [Patescibacteria group bacterium]|nr:murein biosynthesis integral membrane protein MurJ [Patescibacteria group bacterium]
MQESFPQAHNRRGKLSESTASKFSSAKTVQTLLKNGASFLFTRQTNILSAAIVIMIMVAISRVLGLIRDRLLAGLSVGDPNIHLDLVGIYLASFRIPDLLFQLLVFGSLSVAFIPVFTELLEQHKEKEAWHFASSLVNLSFVLFLGISVVIIIFAEPVSLLVVPGLRNENIEHLPLMANLTRIILFAQIFFVISSFFTGILQSFQHFFVPALAGIFYNIGIITGILFLTPVFGIYGPALGAVFGAFLHFLIQLPSVRYLGFRYCFHFDRKDRGVRDVIRLVVPRTIALAATQISFTINTSFASLVSLSSISFFTFAQHLQLVPYGLFGASIAQAALPSLSSDGAKGKFDQFKVTLLTSFHQILFLVFPASAILIALRIPMVRLVFGAAGFPWEATVTTAKTLAYLSFGLFAEATTPLLVRAFYALKDTRTPLKIALISITVNIFLSILFLVFFKLPLWWIGLAISLANVVEAGLLLFVLDKRLGGFHKPSVIFPAIKIGGSAVFTAVVLWGLMKYFDQLVFDTTRTINLLLLTGTVGFIGMSLYIFLTWALRVKEVTLFWAFFMRIKNWRTAIRKSEEVIDGATTNS